MTEYTEVLASEPGKGRKSIQTISIGNADEVRQTSQNQHQNPALTWRGLHAF